MTPDPRVRVIAAEFCTHRAAMAGTTWPCRPCLTRAENACAAIDQRPRLFDPGRLHDAPLVPLDDMAPPATHGNATDTERAARWALEPRVGSQRHLILNAFIRDEDRRTIRSGDGEAFVMFPQGWTDDELAMHVHPSAARRRCELFQGGWLRDTGRRRQTRAGSSAIVWRLTREACERLGLSVAAEAREA